MRVRMRRRLCVVSAAMTQHLSKRANCGEPQLCYSM